MNDNLEWLEWYVKNYLLSFHDGYVYYELEQHQAEPSEGFPDHSYITIRYNDRNMFQHCCDSLNHEEDTGGLFIKLDVEDIGHSDMIIRVIGVTVNGKYTGA